MTLDELTALVAVGEGESPFLHPLHQARFRPAGVP